MALFVTPAHVNDGDMAPALMKQVAKGTKVKFFMLDAGYDQLKTMKRHGSSKRKRLSR